MSTPTAEGLRRYPHTRGYFPDLSARDAAPDLELPCVCAELCAPRCAGECGCLACGTAFSEFCSEAGQFGADGHLRDEQQALASYRGVAA